MQRQQYVHEFIAHTSHNIFLTGKAGTGKTTLLHQIRTKTYKSCIVAAPTGIAALNAGGVTLHSLLQLPIGAFIPDSSAELTNIPTDQLFVTPKGIHRHIHLQDRKIRLLRAMELLVIDEVSMLRADTLDLIDVVLRSVRRSPLPFGGVQVLFIGDLLQLPPVVKPQEWAVLQHYYESPFFFHAQVLRKYPPLYIELTHVYRQQDGAYLELLNHLRYNSLTEADHSWLQSRIDPHFDPIHNEGYVTLTTHNARADEINERALNALPGGYQDYHARISGEFPQHLYPVDPLLKLKVGARVMMIKNDQEIPRRFYNGMLATVEHMEGDELCVRLENGELLNVPHYSWENARYVLKEKTGQTEAEVLGTFSHYPIRLAWAITIHKSQGLTFDRAAIDLEAVFASGQAYVALSRLRSPKGLTLLSSISPRTLTTPQPIVDYEETRVEDSVLESTLAAERTTYWRTQCLTAFACQECTRLWRDHAYSYRMESERSKKSAFGDWAAESLAKMEQIQQVADRFISQLQSLWTQGEGALPLIAERIGKASEYFLPLWRELLVGLLEVQVKARGLGKVKEFVAELDELQRVVTQHISLVIRIQACIQALGKGIYPDRESTQIDEQIETWFRETRAAVKTPYIVPAPSTEKTKKREPKAKKEPKLTTQEQTLQLLKQGKSYLEIADERSLQPSTILVHIAQLLEQDLITEREAGIEEETMQELIPHFEKMNPEEGLRPVMEAIGEAHPYGILRLYLAAYRHLHAPRSSRR